MRPQGRVGVPMKGFGITDRGAVRRENQDSFRMEILEGGDSAVMVLCDGMGGARPGALPAGWRRKRS
jgi:serine/threonine protein phosphatase PrpC